MNKILANPKKLLFSLIFAVSAILFIILNKYSIFSWFIIGLDFILIISYLYKNIVAAAILGCVFNLIFLFYNFIAINNIFTYFLFALIFAIFLYFFVFNAYNMWHNIGYTMSLSLIIIEFSLVINMFPFNAVIQSIFTLLLFYLIFGLIKLYNANELKIWPVMQYVTIYSVLVLIIFITNQ